MGRRGVWMGKWRRGGGWEGGRQQERGRGGKGGEGMCFFSSRRRHTRYWRDWSSDVCSSDLNPPPLRRVIDQRREPPESRLFLLRAHHPQARHALVVRRLRLKERPRLLVPLEDRKSVV